MNLKNKYTIVIPLILSTLSGCGENDDVIYYNKMASIYIDQIDNIDKKLNEVNTRVNTKLSEVNTKLNALDKIVDTSVNKNLTTLANKLQYVRDFKIALQN
ncbi:hypothetical protein [Candidatus Liberibacter americanus]|uniref:Lipoprotein n=1 Tax=Candidatus Liberibacter americanus str. Sao Paulo TaxID=1261131 RepID=U6B546_9HYPH|nr:hypothetical protein [Candidatus Liberibacter americanus]AHA28179.1 hypothetical protein lam_840 [Candidatus Liberibacter americanus str. Sao Paulo]EMS35853.1 hypothetical protein G653_04596 [Candidatus Liberibacter americanus PW_SP]